LTVRKAGFWEIFKCIENQGSIPNLKKKKFIPLLGKWVYFQDDNQQVSIANSNTRTTLARTHRRLFCEWGTSARQEPNVGEPNTHNSQFQGPESSSTNPGYEALQKNWGKKSQKCIWLSKMVLADQFSTGS